jgi:ubiquinone/menaquinone biosynthesis C-methylase UbiE
MAQKEWFSEWFDSHYYHILYQHRNDDEARYFLDNLVQKLDVKPGQQVIDLACGKGRHAKYLNEIGFDVTGVDLSESSIAYANQFANSRLKFVVQDIRSLSLPNQYDFAFNLFTSFGYFQNEKEDMAVLQGIHSILKKNGMLVVDFFNKPVTLAKLVPEETKRIGELIFEITRRHDERFLYKYIHVIDGHNRFEFVEQVQLLNNSDFERMLQNSGFTIMQTFGSYGLDAYDALISDRLIILAQKH